METEARRKAREAFADIANATAFLTRLPVPAAWQDLSRGIGVRAFPLVGLLAGGLTAASLASLSWLGVPPLAAAGIALGLTALLTGGLHEDGLADLADGFGGGRSRERKLEIMRDSRIGSYGVIALVLVLLVKAASLPGLSVAQIILAAVLSRFAMVGLVWSTPAARDDGLSAGAGRPDGMTIVESAIVTGLLALLMSAVGGTWQSASVACGVCVGMTAILGWLSRRQIGGQTGDVCGGLQLLSETAMLAAFAALH